MLFRCIHLSCSWYTIVHTKGVCMAGFNIFNWKESSPAAAGVPASYGGTSTQGSQPKPGKTPKVDKSAVTDLFRMLSDINQYEKSGGSYVPPGAKSGWTPDSYWAALQSMDPAQLDSLVQALAKTDYGKRLAGMAYDLIKPQQAQQAKPAQSAADTMYTAGK